VIAKKIIKSSDRGDENEFDDNASSVYLSVSNFTQTADCLQLGLSMTTTMDIIKTTL
jgi:hypothetical protein